MLKETEGHVGQNDQNPQEALFNGKVVFSRKLTLRNVIPEIEDYRNGLLLDKPFTFEVRRRGDSFLNIASFSEKDPLNRKWFAEMLNMAKPGGASRPGQGVGGVIGDWRVILPKVREEEAETKRLYDFHTKYVPGFPEFEQNHFEKFWNIMSPLSVKEERLLMEQFGRLISKEKLLAEYGIKFYKGIEGLHAISLPDDSRKAFSELFNSRNLGLNLDPDLSVSEFRSTIGLELSKLPEDKRLELLVDFYNQISSTKGEVEVALDGADASDTYAFAENIIMVDENGNIQDRSGIYLIGAPILSNGAGSIRSIGNGQIEIRKGNSYLIVSLENLSYTGYKEPVIKVMSIASHIVPVIIWKEDQTGEKEFFCGKIPREWIKRYPNLFSDRHDALAGQLLVAAYSPKQRDKMPREYKIIDENGKIKIQQMFEAQSVLLIRMPEHQEIFLKESPVILELEALAK